MDIKRKIKIIVSALLVVAIIIVVFFVVGIDIKAPVLRGVEYEGFYAIYENKEEDTCSTKMHVDSDGVFSYYYSDGCIYKDFDMYEKYSYTSAGILNIKSAYVPIPERLKVIEWTTEKLVVEEEGVEKVFEVDSFLYTTEKKLEGTYPLSDRWRDLTASFEFKTDGTVIGTDYPGIASEKIKTTYEVHYDPNKEMYIVLIQNPLLGAPNRYELDEENHKLYEVN